MGVADDARGVYVRLALLAPLMSVRQTLRPGQRGTRRFVDRYGDRLVCVRYRYDAETKRRMTTVEVIVDEGAWTPKLRPDEEVGVRVVWGELETARAVKRAGGRWDAGRRLWVLPWARVQALGLEERVVRLDGL